MKKILLLLIAFICTANTFAADYYWVGGTGNWSNFATHWRIGSTAGPAAVQVPQTTDNVFFVGGSFTANNQTVTLDNTTSVCANFDATGITRTGIRFVNTGANSTLNVYGDFKTAGTPNIASWTGTGVIRFFGAANHEVSTNGLPIGNVVSFQMPATGVYSFTSNFTVNPRAAQIVSGTVNFGTGLTHTFVGLTVSGTSTTLNLGSSTVNLASIYITSAVQLNGGTSNVTAGLANISGGETVLKASSSFYNLTLTGNQVSLSASVLRATNKISLLGGSMEYVSPITSSLIVAPTIELQAGKIYYVPKNINTDNLVVLGSSCTAVTTINGSAAIGSTNFNRSTGSWATTPFSYLSLNRTNFTGGVGNAIATSSIDGGNNTGVDFSGSAVSTLYWIGGSNGLGTGNWDEAANWSTTDPTIAVTPAACVPDINTNVVFNAGSFNAAGPLNVNVNIESAFCRDMTWLHNGGGAVLRPVVPVGATTNFLNINGSLILTPGMTTNITATGNSLMIRFIGTANHTITTTGVTIVPLMVINAKGGTYTLLDNLTNLNNFEIYSGTFDTNGKTLNLNAFHILNDDVTATPGTVFLRNSTLNINRTRFPHTSDLGTSLYYALYVSTNKTVNYGTSNIFLESTNSTANEGRNAALLGPVASNQILYNLTIGSSWEYANLYNYQVGKIISFNNLSVLSSASISKRTSAGNNYKINNNLTLAAGKFYSFPYNVMVDFDATGSLIANGTCANPISIQASPAGTISSFRKTSGTITGDYLKITDITAGGGATFTATNSIGFGTTTGWNLTAGAGRNLYWVGGAGNWNEPAHWSLTDGGAGGECPPNANDNVFFTNSSFTAANQIVNLNVPIAVRDFDASGATTYPHTFQSSLDAIAFYSYGSLKFANATTWNWVDGAGIVFAGTGNHVLATKGKNLHPTGGGNTYLRAPGNYTLEDDFADYDFYLQQGGLDLAGKNTNVRTFSSGTTNNFPPLGPRDLKMGSGTFTVVTFYLVSAAVPTYPLTFDAGTSTIVFSGNFTPSAGIQFYKLRSASGTIGNSSSSLPNKGNFFVRDMQFGGISTIAGDFTIQNDIIVNPGSTIGFTSAGYSANPTVFLTKNEDQKIIGTGALPIFINTGSTGFVGRFNKPTHRLCVDFLYVKNMAAMGGAEFRGGGNADDQGGNTGWDFAPYPEPGTASINAPNPQAVCPNTNGMVSLNFTANAEQDFPKLVEYTVNGVVNSISISHNDASPAGPYLINIPNITAATTVQITKITATGCFEKLANVTASNIIANFTIAPKVSPIAASNQKLCATVHTSLANITITGTDIKWYADLVTPTVLPSTTLLMSGTTYYATQTVAGGCESDRVPVTVVLENCSRSNPSLRMRAKK